MIRTMVTTLVALSLAACASRPSPAAPGAPPQVDVQVSVSCVPPELGPPPGDLLTAAQLAAIPAGPDRYTAIAADWMRRVARMNDTEAVVRGCRAH